MEYAALDSETPLTELPSFKSMLRRTSVDQGLVPDSWPRGAFLEAQFNRIFLMFIPYSLLGSDGVIAEFPTQLSNRWDTVLGVALSGACIVGSMFLRPRILFATLATFGFFWAVPMRQNAAIEEFESVYYIGLPLVFFTIVLLLARRMTNRDGVIAAVSVATMILFAASSFQMSRLRHSAEFTQISRSTEQDLLAIHELVAGEHVTVLNLGSANWYIFDWQWEFYALRYYLHQSIFRFRLPSPTDDRFTVMGYRVGIDALLTPQNQYLFLYDTAGLTAWYRSTYRSVMSTMPLARKEFDVYLIDGTVYFLKEQCDGSNLTKRLFLHVFPEDEDDLPDDRRRHRFDNFDFAFRDRGLLFGSRCLASVDLPQYDIAGIRTGRLHGDGTEVWSISHVVQGPKLISEYQTIVSREPIVRSEFDLYINGSKLYYVKEPCDGADVQTSFFLHVVPADEDDLPDDRREHGFDNLDFGFDVRGVIFDGKCAAAAPLPKYGIARIITGQFDGDGRVWGVEFAPEAGR